jgi:hypothetical protein
MDVSTSLREMDLWLRLHGYLGSFTLNSMHLNSLKLNYSMYVYEIYYLKSR